MEGDTPDPFKEQIDRILNACGLTFSGIHIRCTVCGEQAFAATPEIAETFGWSQVKQRHGAQYDGICINCTNSAKT